MSQRARQAIVRELRRSREVTHNIRYGGNVRELPSRAVLQHILNSFCAALFPHFGQAVFTDLDIDDFVDQNLERAFALLEEQVRRGLQFDGLQEDDGEDLGQKASRIVAGLAGKLAQVRNVLVSDLKAAYRGDPAAGSIAEVLLCYRGSIAIIYHRLAHELHARGARMVARLVADIAHAATGIDIHPGAEIGESFFIDHGTGVVIGETAIIGKNVRLYQAVTLGARQFDTGPDGALIKGQPRHPIIEDNVIIYAGATILGRIVVGRNSTIGGNVWLTHSVPAGSNITQAKSESDREPGHLK